MAALQSQHHIDYTVTPISCSGDCNAAIAVVDCCGTLREG